MTDPVVQTLSLTKARIRIVRRFSLLLALFSIGPPDLFAQGSLTPPGAPAPTMKTLAQIEPRTPITNTAAVNLIVPGSYYLTTNITVTTGNAIIISTNNVTLDLNGFTIFSTAPSATGSGIRLAFANTDITIINGHIKGGVTNNAGVYSGSGFANGIFWAGPNPSNVHVVGVSVAGCLTFGIFLGGANSTVVESCTVQTVGGSGIVAGSVSHSTVYECGGDAINADTASDCSGSTTGSGAGVLARTVNNCVGVSAGSGFGVSANTANNCFGQSFSGTGLLAAATANNCDGTSSTGNGLSVPTGVAIGCYGFTSSALAFGVFARIANSCVVAGGATNILFKYNMP